MTILLLVALSLQDDFEKKLDALVPRLASDDPAERSAAGSDLKKLVDSDRKSARKQLRARISTEKDPEVKSALQTALAALPDLELTIKVEGEARIGRPVKFKVRIKNVSDQEQVVIRSLDGSDFAIRYPHYLARFFDSDGGEIQPGKVGRCGNTNLLNAADLATLKPDDEFDPFGEGSFGNYYLQTWTPAKAGKYKVELVCDFAAPDLSRYNGAMERNNGLGGAQKLLARVPKVKLEAKVEFEIKP